MGFNSGFKGLKIYKDDSKITTTNFIHLTLKVSHDRTRTLPSVLWYFTALQPGRSRVRFPMVSLKFFIDIILLAALWPWDWLSL